MIVGLSGYARSGKDTFGLMLAEHGFKTIGFADPLRDAAKAINPIVGFDSDGDAVHYNDALAVFGYNEMKFVYPEARRFLQHLGTEFGRRQVSDTFWVDMAMAKIGGGADNVVITDCRFENEALAIKAIGGIVVRIDRPGCEPANAHPSETELDDWAFDARIPNDGTLEDLAKHAAAIAAQRDPVHPW